MLKLYTEYILYFFFLVFFTGLFIGILERRINNQIYTVFGKFGLYINSLIGTPIHELGHLLFVLLSGSKIIKIKLIPKYTDINNDCALGYVNYKCKNTLINNIWMFFIGIGPIISGSFSILIILKILLNNVYYNFLLTINEILNNKYLFFDSFSRILKSLIINMININNLKNINFYIFIFLSTCIAYHMSLSIPDIKVSLNGFFYLIIVLFIISIILTILNINVLNYMFIFLSFFSILCIISIIFTFLEFLITYFLLYLKI